MPGNNLILVASFICFHNRLIDHTDVPSQRRKMLEQKPNLRGVVEMVRGGFFLGKKPLGDSALHYTDSAFAIEQNPNTSPRFCKAGFRGQDCERAVAVVCGARALLAVRRWT